MISLILPVYNEAETLPETIQRLRHFITNQKEDFEIIYVDDGSTDQSVALIKQAIQADPTIRLLQFSRNFGHQIAISAGIRYASGDAVVVMDADLQDPPEVITQMVERWRSGFDVVYGKRSSRAGESWFKKMSAETFYRLLAKLTEVNIPLDTGDFRLMDKKVVQQLIRMNETHPFVRGMVSWVGFKQTEVLYERQERYAGESKYPLKKMIGLAFDGITGFSEIPLRFANYLGGTLLGISLVYLLFKLATLEFNRPSLILFLLLFLSSGIFITIGILGTYLARLVAQSKDRPLYIIDEAYGFPENKPKLFRLHQSNDSQIKKVQNRH